MVATASFVSPLRYSRDRKQPLRERLAVDLPGTGPERLALEPDTRGQLVFRDPAGKPGAQTVLRALEAGRHRNGGPDRLEAQWVREREDYAVLDRRVGEDRLFDLFRIHLQAPVVEHLIDPPREVQAPFLTAMDHVDRGSWSYVPNSLGELTSQTNARGQTLQMTYDLLGRPLTRVEPEGTTTWTWGTQPGQYEIGRLAQVSGPGGYAEAYDYDSAGRLVQTTITADGGPYVINRDYNSAGLVDSLTYPASTGAPLRVRYGYDHGLLDRVSDYDNPATVFWQLNTMDARGQALDETLGSANPAISVLSSYDPMTGLLESRTASVGSTLRQDLSFTWDAGGNLKSRTDHIQGALTEEFFYDSLGRLDYSRRAGVQNLDLSYDAYGNIASRVEGGGSYSYQYSHGAHPHAVSAVLHDCGCSCLSDDYAYDGNGNMTSRVGSAISWSSYDLPLVLNQDGASSQFAYTPGRSRWKQVAVYSASTTETTLYLGGVMEKVTRGAVTEWKHYIPAGAGSTALHIRKSAGTPASATYYVTGDHLGSATAVMDGGGALLSQLSFAAFGSRRGSAWQDQPLAADWNVITATTRRGFTGHEHLDNLSLVHMNGRVYDPKLGRFLSADPVYGGDLAQPQTLNPYSYVVNNPLTAVDPEGFASTSSVCQNVPNCEIIYISGQEWIEYGFPLPDGIKVMAEAWNIRIFASVDFSGLDFLDWQDSVVPPWEPNLDVNLEGLVQEETAKWDAEKMLEKERQSRRSMENLLCEAGNSVAEWSDALGNGSGKVLLAGLGIAGVGFVTAQPEITVPGLALTATGGLGSIGAGVLQIGAGLLQGAGGGGFSNSGYAALSLATGLALARGITGPAVSGYRTVSQRTGDAFRRGTATVAGGVNDAWTNLVDAAAPRQVSCPGGN